MTTKLHDYDVAKHLRTPKNIGFVFPPLAQLQACYVS